MRTDRLLWAQTGPAAVRHANLDLAGFGATNQITGPSPKRTWPNETLGGLRSFAAPEN
ncbi:MAG: hypothetical protein ABJG04_00630 [Roseobacter sp.]